MLPNTADDHSLMDELNRLGKTLGPFVFGILSDTLSVSEQLDFGYRLIAVAGRIRARVEHQSVAPGDQGGDTSLAGNGDGL